jgi:predicted DNA-binding protein (UPF0251 family)
MVKAFQNAIRKRGERSREALLLRLEGELDGIYDLIYQMTGDEAHALQVLESVLRRCTRLSKHERYERYLKLWVLGVTIECLRRAYPRFLSECTEDQTIPLEALTMEEKFVLFLHDRSQLSYEEIAAVTQIPVGRVGRCLTYAREKVAKDQGYTWQEDSLALRERVSWNRHESCVGAPDSYASAIMAARIAMGCAPVRRFADIDVAVRQQKLLPLLGQPDRVRWHDLSWRAKLGLEASFLVAAGLIAVVVLPWMLSRVNTNAFVEGRFADVFQVETKAGITAQAEGITADRLLAAAEPAIMEERTEGDEFANVEFPSGDGAETGTAPLAPSRQAAAVYRMIVQSPAPQELIPHVRSVFAEKQVRERDSSGRVMPGGVYFDGVTNVGTYPQILQAMQKLGQTKTYSNNPSRNPNERARVIVWVQQI